MCNNAGRIGAVFLGLILVVGIFLMILCTTKVPAGYVAVQYNMNGGIKDEVLTQGWHLVSPTTKTTNYTVGLEQSYLTSGNNGDSKEDESFSACSSEGKETKIDLTFTYQYDPNRVNEVFTYFKGQSGTSVRDSFIKPNIISWTKEIVASYKVTEILGAERAQINVALTDYLAERFEKYGIIVSNVSLINVDVDEDTNRAISEKIKAQQEAETQAINNKTNVEKAEADAKVKLAQAQADANARLIQAEAEAEAIKIHAEAEAEANHVLADSLTGKVLDKMYYDTWNGILPNVVVGNGSDSTIVIPSN